MTKFVALRRMLTTNRTASTQSVEDQRLAAAQTETNGSKRALLQAIGLTQVNPVDRAPQLRHTFKRLDFLKA